MKVMAEKINAEIIEATSCPLEPEKQRVHVIRWNAMREVVDSGINHINDTRKWRDDLNKENEEWQKQQQSR